MARRDDTDTRGRGPVAVADMKARLAAGWTVEQLWDRLQAAEAGDGFSYDLVEALPNPEKCTDVTTSKTASAVTT